MARMERLAEHIDWASRPGRTGARASFAAKQLKDIGFTNVTIVDMNIEDWEKKGYPFVTSRSSGRPN